MMFCTFLMQELLLNECFALLINEEVVSTELR